MSHHPPPHRHDNVRGDSPAPRRGPTEGQPDSQPTPPRTPVFWGPPVPTGSHPPTGVQPYANHYAPSTAPGWGPPSPGPRRRSGRHAVTTLLAAVVALALAGAVAWQVVLALAPTDADTFAARQPSPRSASTSPAPVRPPEAAPAPPAPSPPPPQEPWQLPHREWEPLPTPAPRDDLWAALQGAPLLEEVPATLGDCPAARSVTTEPEYRQLVAQQWHCVHAAWLPILTRHGFTTAEPEISFYPGAGTTSECGYLEAPAFYCSAGSGTVFFGVGHMEMAMEWDLSVNEMVNHEYAHHLQGLAGITAAKLALPESDEVERRAELQATCWSAAMTRNNEIVDFNQDDWDSWQTRLETMIIDGIHGSRDSILYWGTRGLYAETLGDCNTWAVAPERVS